MTEPHDIESTNAEEVVDPKPSVLRRFGLWLRETGTIVVIALVLSVFLRSFVFQAFYVPSGSMENTLLINDRIIASKLSLKVGHLHRGDVIVFHDPGGWLPDPVEPTGLGGKVANVLKFIGVLPANSGSDLVKRVIGLPGDHIKCCSVNGNLVINGVEVDESAYALDGTDELKFDIIVPDGRVFVMGDNRAHSSDSRFHMSEYHGTVPMDDIVGQVTMLIWPINRFGTIDPSAALQTVPNP